MSTPSSVRPIEPDVALRWGACTDAGGRPRNEDGHLAERPVFLVADGMGGHEDGQAAAREVVAAFRPLAGDDWLTASDLRRAIRAASDRVAALARGGRLPGSTIAGAVLTQDAGQAGWLVFNIGASRVYRLGADDPLEQISVDHSHVQEMLESGRLTRSTAQGHARRNVITRALGAGMRGVPEADQWLVPVTAGDRLVICTDGLTTEVTDPLIAATLLSVADPEDAARALVQAALDAGGRDNVTVIVIDVVSGAADPTTGPRTTEITLDRLPPVDLEATTIPARRGVDRRRGH